MARLACLVNLDRRESKTANGTRLRRRRTTTVGDGETTTVSEAL